MQNQKYVDHISRVLLGREKPTSPSLRNKTIYTEALCHFCPHANVVF